MTASTLTSRRNACAIAARLALVLALVLAAFAHRPAAPTPSGMTALEMAQYVLPDGTLPVLCLPGQNGQVSGSFCEFCLIAGNAAPSAPGSCLSAEHLRAMAGAPVATKAGPPVATAHLETAPLRGPPVIS